MKENGRLEYITDFVNHVTFRMPAFITRVTINLHKLLQNGGIATKALGGKARRVMVMTIYVIIVLVIRVLGAKQR